MQDKILLVSTNEGKLREFRQLIPQHYLLYGLKEIQWSLEIPEPFQTFGENALAKASFVCQHTGMDCLADDSGLVIDSLNGRPGVFSARYAGPGKGDKENIEKILAEMSGVLNRHAHFSVAICFLDKSGDYKVFTGKVNGKISNEPVGESGFGYDPIFIPDGFYETFASLKPEIKNKISHRAIAMKKLVAYLSNRDYLKQ